MEWVLTRVYRKLGVRSRTELAAEVTAHVLGVSGPFRPALGAGLHGQRTDEEDTP